MACFVFKLKLIIARSSVYIPDVGEYYLVYPTFLVNRIYQPETVFPFTLCIPNDFSISFDTVARMVHFIYKGSQNIISKAYCI